MPEAEQIPLPRDVLFKLLPASFEPWGSSSWYPSKPPTAKSLARIRAELGVDLPELFVAVAHACASYGGWFCSIGDNFEHHGHIIRLNEAFYAEGVPRRYVLLNHGHDGDCDAWDKEGEIVNNEFPIVYFKCWDERKGITHLRPYALNFASYIDRFVKAHAKSCPIKNLRREAKRILANFEQAT